MHTLCPAFNNVKMARVAGVGATVRGPVVDLAPEFLEPAVPADFLDQRADLRRQGGRASIPIKMVSLKKA